MGRSNPGMQKVTSPHMELESTFGDGRCSGPNIVCTTKVLWIPIQGGQTWSPDHLVWRGGLFMYIQQAPTVQLSQWLQFPAAGPRRKSFEVVGSAVDVLWMVIVARQLDDIISTTTTTTTCGFNKVNGTCAIWSLSCYWGQHRLARHNTRPWPGSGVYGSRWLHTSHKERRSRLLSGVSALL